VSPLSSPLLFFLSQAGDQTQGLVHLFYHWAIQPTLFLFLILRHSLNKLPRLVLNMWSFCLISRVAGITDGCLPTHPGDVYSNPVT
jgi:hypothetical protein